MLDRPASAAFRALRGAPLPVEAMLVGRTAAEAAELLPRLFSLCRAAQALAARLALGLDAAPAGARPTPIPSPQGGGEPLAAPLGDDRPAEGLAAVAREIRRDHLMKFHVSWPGLFGCAPTPLPANWAEGGRSVAAAVFGPAGAMPATLADFRAWLAAGTGIAPTLARIAGTFAPGEAVARDLPFVDADTAFRPQPVENSVGARTAAHPLMRAMEAATGRGPLWRATARALDLQATLTGAVPAPLAPAPGRALVPAARGLYAIAARVAQGRVAGFSRVTPTDHLLAPGGVLDGTLAALPADRGALLPLLLDILDPCMPVRVEGVPDA